MWPGLHYLVHDVEHALYELGVWFQAHGFPELNTRHLDSQDLLRLLGVQLVEFILNSTVLESLQNAQFLVGLSQQKINLAAFARDFYNFLRWWTPSIHCHNGTREKR